MSNNKMLFIVEGANDEVAFVQQLFAKCPSFLPYDIYSYNCNIHILSQILHDEYPSFETDEIDIQLVLKSKEENEEKRTILSQIYRDIFLIFDFDPHHDHPHFDTVYRMLQYFSDSSNHGKLFINYPMMQSYKHFAFLPDDSFKTRQIAFSDCNRYKSIVASMSKYTDLTTYSYTIFISLIVHHLRKANYLLTGKYDIPSCDEYLSWNGSQIYNYQYDLLNESNLISVLNTSIFLGIDFRPNEFFRIVTTRACDFDI